MKEQIERQAIEEMAKIAFPFLKEVEEEHLNTVIFGNIHIAQPILNLYKQGYRKQEWISVEEALPKQWEIVLVSSDGIISTDFIASSGRWYEHIAHDAVTHWMPLPEPPKGGAE